MGIVLKGCYQPDKSNKFHVNKQPPNRRNRQANLQRINIAFTHCNVSVTGTQVANGSIENVITGAIDRCIISARGGLMSGQVPIFDESYDAKRRFVSQAKTLLVKFQKVATEEKRPELKIHIEAMVGELETFLADLDEEFDKAWKENSKQISASLEELVILIEQVQAEGRALDSVIDQTWPIRDDLNAFLSELNTVSNLLRVHLDGSA